MKFLILVFARTIGAINFEEFGKEIAFQVGELKKSDAIKYQALCNQLDNAISIAGYNEIAIKDIDNGIKELPKSLDEFSDFVRNRTATWGAAQSMDTFLDHFTEFETQIALLLSKCYGHVDSKEVLIAQAWSQECGWHEQYRNNIMIKKYQIVRTEPWLCCVSGSICGLIGAAFLDIQTNLLINFGACIMSSLFYQCLAISCISGIGATVIVNSYNTIWVEYTHVDGTNCPHDDKIALVKFAQIIKDTKNKLIELERDIVLKAFLA